MEPKINKLRSLMANGQWVEAIKFAAKFPRLGDERNAILTASSALLSPALYRSMGRDPEVLLNLGREALLRRYQKPS